MFGRSTLSQTPVRGAGIVKSFHWKSTGTAPFFRFKLSANPRLRETQWKRSQRLTTVLY